MKIDHTIYQAMYLVKLIENCHHKFATHTHTLAHTVVVETELLIDYYLVPGAEWSLIKKGEIVQVIGKAKDTGWYRCMALRESKVELDRAPFSFMIKSMIDKPKVEVSGITPEMVEEQYSKRDQDEKHFSLSSDVLAEVN